jgi:hypothetical protein
MFSLPIFPGLPLSGLAAGRCAGGNTDGSSPLLPRFFEEVALEYVVPQWVRRVGNTDTEAVWLFSRNVGPVAGMKANHDGNASPIDNQQPTGTGGY